MWFVTLLSTVVLGTQAKEKLTPLTSRSCGVDRYFHLGSQLIDHYFIDRHYVNVIETSFDNEALTKAMVCEVKNIPVYVMSMKRFQRQVKHKRSKYDLKEQTKNIYEHPTVEAFLSWGTAETLIIEVLPYIAYRNPQAKIVLTTYFLNAENIAEIFHKGWYHYKLLHILVMNYWDGSQIENCMFNPFAKDLQEGEHVKPSDLSCTLVTSAEQIHAHLEEVEHFDKNRVRKLNGHKVAIAMHESHGTRSAFDCVLDNFKISDVDMDILAIFQEKMNFTASYYISELELSVGYVYPNGSLAGTLGLIENNHVDLAANSRIIHDYGTKNLLYLNYITTEKLKFLVPQDYFADRDKQVIFINPFSISYMIINIVLSIVIPLIMLVLEKILVYLRPIDDHCTFGESVLRMLGIIYNVSVSQPTTSRKRWIVFGLLVYNIVSYPVWQAVTIRYLNSDNQHLNNINTLDELLASDLTLKVSTYHEHVVVHEGSEFQNVNYRELSHRLTTKDTSSIRTSIEQIIIQRDSAFLTSDEYVPLVLSGSYKWIPEHTAGVYVIPEPIYEFYKSMAVPKTSPFLRTFNEIIMRYVESGFVERQSNQLKMVVDLLKIQQILEQKLENGERLFDMGVLWIFFVFYLIMMALSTVVFILEIVIHTCRNKRTKVVPNPNLKKTDEDAFEPFEFVN